jgi:hypothetical protein
MIAFPSRHPEPSRPAVRHRPLSTRSWRGEGCPKGGVRQANPRSAAASILTFAMTRPHPSPHTPPHPVPLHVQLAWRGVPEGRGEAGQPSASCYRFRATVKVTTSGRTIRPPKRVSMSRQRSWISPSRAVSSIASVSEKVRSSRAYCSAV